MKISQSFYWPPDVLTLGLVGGGHYYHCVDQITTFKFALAARSGWPAGIARVRFERLKSGGLRCSNNTYTV